MSDSERMLLEEVSRTNLRRLQWMEAYLLDTSPEQLELFLVWLRRGGSLVHLIDTYLKLEDERDA